jgi:hypothetical protein
MVFLNTTMFPGKRMELVPRAWMACYIYEHKYNTCRPDMAAIDHCKRQSNTHQVLHLQLKADRTAYSSVSRAAHLMLERHLCMSADGCSSAAGQVRLHVC